MVLQPPLLYASSVMAVIETSGNHYQPMRKQKLK